ncbi:MAG: malto-oligosyltrehalose trehalohydrolase [Alteromonadaceae bacterium]|nr:malto-oligosyltrehalose trehalohydrolase [Alteromonadaceae bacterium]
MNQTAFRQDTAFQPRFGAHPSAPDRVRFSLWAPSANRVSLEVEGRDPEPMQPASGGAFELETEGSHGLCYRYRVFGDAADTEGTAVPDPASRAQEGDIGGPSCVVDPDHFHWKHQEWKGRPWVETVIYELHVGALGGFDGVRERLGYLARLGVTAIELMPVAEFPGGRNWGYDGVLPYAVEAAYGGPDALKRLIDEAHGYGLMVFLDVVYNHFGPDGNYLAQYADRFFRQDIETPWGAAIDFRQPEVRQYFVDNALMWLHEYRLDGLRFDAVHAISERDFLEELAEEVHHRIPAGRHVHLILENEANTAGLLQEKFFTAQWNDDGHNVLHVLMTGEQEGYYADFIHDSTRKLVRCLEEGFIYQGEQSRHGRPRGEPSAHLPPHAFVLFLQNHDQIGNRALGERLITLAHEDAVTAATTLLLLSPMIPLMFMGEEWGSRRPFLFFTEHSDDLADAVREGRRNEFAAFEAFNDEAQRLRIPDPNALETFEASVPDFDSRLLPPHKQWLDLYRSLLSLRRKKIVPRLPGTKSLGATMLANGAVLARWRLGDGSELSLALNLSETEAPLSLDKLFDGGARLLTRYCLHASRPSVITDVDNNRLPARSAVAALIPATAMESMNG